MKFACFSTDFNSFSGLVSKINEYKKQGDELHCIAFKYYYNDSEIETLTKLPIDKLLVITNINLMNYDMEGFSNALLECFKKYKYDIIFVGNKIEDREVGARLSSKIGATLVIGCLDFKIDSNKLYAEKASYGRVFISTLETNLPAIISFENLSSGSQMLDSKSQLEEMKIQIIHSRIIVRDKTKLSNRYFNLEKSPRILCIGENIHEEKELKDLEELSRLLKADLVGDKTVFSRNWLKEWVGYSNLKVKPEILIDLGINGDLDHVGGILDSKLVISINEDPNSMVFNYSDYYAVADIHKLIPKLIKKLSKIK